MGEKCPTKHFVERVIRGFGFVQRETPKTYPALPVDSCLKQSIQETLI